MVADAWMLNGSRTEGQIIHEDLLISWRGGMNSALANQRIKEERDVAYVEVQKRTRAR